jgi:hypothetical protein
VSAPIGSLKDLQKLLNGEDQYIYMKKSFPFYSVLLYTPTNGINQALHMYVVDNFEFFHVATGPNWLVAVIEDIGAGHQINEFKPQYVYTIARYLGAPVDQIPAFVFFTDPKEHKDTLILPLNNSGLVTIEDVKKHIVKIAAVIDKICSDQHIAEGTTGLQNQGSKLMGRQKFQAIHKHS